MTADTLVLDEDLAKLVSYLTFDGHLGKNLSRFYLSSSNFVFLKDFEKIVVSKFGLKPHYEQGTGFGFSYKCRFYSSKVAKLLFEAGVPKGDKMLVPFRVPAWIKTNRVFSKAYLSIAFQCEGWISKSTSFNSYLVSFHLNKDELLLDDGISFINDLKEMLLNFGIKTSNVIIQNANLRKDGHRTKSMIFGVRTRSNSLFQKEIRFGLDNRKNLVLEKAALVAERKVQAWDNAFWIDKNALEFLYDKRRAVLPNSLDVDLAKLFAYLLRYGGLSKNLKQFYIISSSTELILDFARIVLLKFNLPVPYARKKSLKSYQCFVSCVAVGRWLKANGFPSRNSTDAIPAWISDDPENLKAFLSITNHKL